MMKTFFTRAAMLLAVVSTACTFTACNDDDDKEQEKEKPFESELIGVYAPTSVTSQDPEISEDSKVTLEVYAEWVDPNNIPGIDLSAVMGLPAGSWALPMNTVCQLLSALGSQFVVGGLVQLDLKNDGTFGAQYHDVIVPTNEETGQTGTTEILSMIMSPEFEKEVKSFPSPETAQVIPDGALSYYTKDGKFYFAVSKEFLKAVGEQEETDILAMIDQIMALYGNLGIVSEEKFYAIPLKYTIDGTIVRFFVDRQMILPFKPLLLDLTKGLDPADTMGIDVSKIVMDLFDQTTKLEISFFVERK